MNIIRSTVGAGARSFVPEGHSLVNKLGQYKSYAYSVKIYDSSDPRFQKIVNKRDLDSPKNEALVGKGGQPTHKVSYEKPMDRAQINSLGKCASILGKIDTMIKNQKLVDGEFKNDSEVYLKRLNEEYKTHHSTLSNTLYIGEGYHPDIQNLISKKQDNVLTEGGVLTRGEFNSIVTTLTNNFQEEIKKAKAEINEVKAGAKAEVDSLKTQLANSLKMKASIPQKSKIEMLRREKEFLGYALFHPEGFEKLSPEDKAELEASYAKIGIILRDFDEAGKVPPIDMITHFEKNIRALNPTSDEARANFAKYVFGAVTLAIGFGAIGAILGYYEKDIDAQKLTLSNLEDRFAEIKEAALLNPDLKKDLELIELQIKQVKTEIATFDSLKEQINTREKLKEIEKQNPKSEYPIVDDLKKGYYIHETVLLYNSVHLAHKELLETINELQAQVEGLESKMK